MPSALYPCQVVYADGERILNSDTGSEFLSGVLVTVRNSSPRGHGQARTGIFHDKSEQLKERNEGSLFESL